MKNCHVIDERFAIEFAIEEAMWHSRERIFQASHIADSVEEARTRKKIFLARLYRDETYDRLRLFKTPATPSAAPTMAISALNMRPGRDSRYARNVITVNYTYSPVNLLSALMYRI